MESCCGSYQPLDQTAWAASAIAAAGVDAAVADVAGAGNAFDDSFVGNVGDIGAAFVRHSSTRRNAHSDSLYEAVCTEGFSVDEVDEEAESYMDLAAYRVLGADGNDSFARVA